MPSDPKNRLVIVDEDLIGRKKTRRDIPKQPDVFGRRPTAAPEEEPPAPKPISAVDESPEFRSLLRDALRGKAD